MWLHVQSPLVTKYKGFLFGLTPNFRVHHYDLAFSSVSWLWSSFSFNVCSLMYLLRKCDHITQRHFTDQLRGLISILPFAKCHLCKTCNSDVLRVL